VVKSLLQARAGLDGYGFEVDGLRVQEHTSLALVSIGIPPTDHVAQAQVLGSQLSVSIPPIGHYATVNDSGHFPIHPDGELPILLSLQQDQLWLLSADGSLDTSAFQQTLGSPSFRCTDQSGAWVLLELSGVRCGQVLERLCALDIDESVFKNDHVVRTAMHHMGCVLLRKSADTFLLLSPRSSALSLVHAIEQSATHVVNEALLHSATA